VTPVLLCTKVYQQEPPLNSVLYTISKGESCKDFLHLASTNFRDFVLLHVVEHCGFDLNESRIILALSALGKV